MDGLKNEWAWMNEMNEDEWANNLIRNEWAHQPLDTSGIIETSLTLKVEIYFFFRRKNFPTKILKTLFCSKNISFEDFIMFESRVFGKNGYVFHRSNANNGILELSLILVEE